jgi:HSP20 family protein
MELAKRNTWDPFEILEELQTDIGRTFGRSQNWNVSFDPHVEVREQEDVYLLSADLPGMKKEDFSITVEGSRLTLKGERKKEKEAEEKGYRYSERHYGTFLRSIEFPVEVDAGKVKAGYKDGVLEITLPKAESAKPKQISVEVK